jgi:hypothetical protein
MSNDQEIVRVETLCHVVKFTTAKTYSVRFQKTIEFIIQVFE